MKLSHKVRIPFVPSIVIIVAQLLFNKLTHGLIIEVYVNTTNATSSSANTRRRTTSRSVVSSVVSYDPTNSTDDENYGDDDWQTTYDADVTITPGTPLMNLSTIQFVLVGIDDQSSTLSSNNLGRSDSTTATRTRESISPTTTVITRQIETYYKGTATSRRAIVSNRQETIWHGSLRDPTNVTVDEQSNNNNNPNKSILRRWRQRFQQLLSYRKKRAKKIPEKDRTGFCSVLEINGLIRSATFTTETEVYDLIYLYDTQQYQIRATSWGDFPPENDIHSESNETTFQNRRTTNEVNPLLTNEFHSLPIKPLQQTTDTTQQNFYNTTNKNNGSGRYVAVSLHQAYEWETRDDGPMKVINVDHDGTSTNRRRIQTSTPFTTVEVLVVVTNRGLCEYISKSTPCATSATNRAPMDNRLKVVEAETNNALKSINVRIRIIKVVYFSSSSYDAISDSDGLSWINDDSSIQTLRDTNYADLVAVVAGNGGGNCGIGILGGYRSVTAQGCLGGYTMSHEIGHNFGGFHNREAMSNWPHPYAYAYRREYQYRTFLSYSCDTSRRCPRIPYYSSATLRLSDGRILGNPTNDNLRLIKAQAPIISRFKVSPTPRPTRKPTNRPTRRPTRVPTRRPTRRPTNRPTRRPTRIPTRRPTRRPTTVPTSRPTASPTRIPTRSPTNGPTNGPTRKPTTNPTNVPTNKPTNKPTGKPTVQPTSKPTVSSRPSRVPSGAPSGKPTISMSPSALPSAQPSERPTISNRPSNKPSWRPSNKPSSMPSNRPSNKPSKQPSHRPSSKPSKQPSNSPSTKPSTKPSNRPSKKPSNRPSTKPSSRPSKQPSNRPSHRPSKLPSRIPSTKPSNAPSSSPTQRRTTCIDTCKSGTANIMYRKAMFWVITRRCLVRCVDELNYEVYTLLGFRCGLSCGTSSPG